MDEEQTTHTTWIEEYDQMDELAKIARMKQHLEDYSMFHIECKDNHFIDDAEIPLLWTTWCIRRGIK